MNQTFTHARDLHISSRGAHGSEFKHTARRCPGCCTDQETAASLSLNISYIILIAATVTA